MLNAELVRQDDFEEDELHSENKYGFCIMEDTIPRDGGVIPEYAATLYIGIDTLGADIASGRIWSFCYRKPIPFNGLGSLLLILDQMLDEMGTPERWLELRSLQSKRQNLSSVVLTPKTVCYKPTALKNARGDVGTAAIRIYMRQNASLQGEVRFLNGVKAQMQFRSALELLHLLQEWLDLICEEKMPHQALSRNPQLRYSPITLSTI